MSTAPHQNGGDDARAHLVPDGDLKAFRVSKREPCPVCHKTDWCLSDGRTWAICKRVDSPIVWGAAGHLHRLNGAPGQFARSTSTWKRTTNEVQPKRLTGWEDDPDGVFSALPLASDDSELAAFMQADYAIEPQNIPPDIRCWFHPQLGRGLTYRVRNEAGSYTYFFKTLKRNNKGKRESRWLSGSEGALVLANIPGAPIVIVHGAEKALAAHAAGYTVFGFMQGEAPLSDEWIRHIVVLRSELVILANDADEAGSKANRGTAGKLEMAGIPSDRLRIAQWPKGAPSGYDLNDHLKIHGLDALLELLTTAPAAPSSLPTTVSAADLRAQEFKAVRWIIDGLRPEGLIVLAARPKKKKSWMELWNSICVATGTPALGRFNTTVGDVLYLALEDSPRRMQSRNQLLLGDAPWPSRLHFAHTWPRLDKGGLDMLSVWLRQHPEAAMVVIDTFTRIKPPCARGADAYQHDADATAELQRLALHHGVSIVLILHQRKAAADDPFDTVSGTLGMTASADIVSILQSKRNSGTLTVTGRDLEEKTLALEFDAGRWICTGEVVPDDDEKSDPLEAAKAFLVEALKNGALDSEAIFKQGTDQGITKKKLFAAKDALRIRAIKSGFNAGWRWSLPCHE